MPPSILVTLFYLGSFAWAQNSCYHAAGQRSGSAIIPCGPSNTISSCCQIGDLCLSDSACWNPTHNVTYLYGCSDPNYDDASCPLKCGPTFDDVPYVGLVYCYNTTQNEWACTHPPAGSDSIQTNPPQQCYDDSIVAFAGPKSLQPILSLPSVVGGSTVYFSQVNPTSYSLDPNYTPTTSVRATASIPSTVEVVSSQSTSSSSSSSARFSVDSSSTPIPTSSSTSTPGSTAVTPTSALQTATSSPSPVPSTQSSGLSVGAKAGIGVGVGLGVVALIALLFLFRRRRSHEPVSQTEENYAQPPSDVKVEQIRPLSELEGTQVGSYYDQSVSGDQSTMSNWGTTSPTFMNSDRGHGRRAGSDGVHELG